MTTITHHLPDRLLMAYSAGALPEAFSLVVATHISMCDECRARLGAYDALGGAVLAACETAEMSDDALAATLARIDAQDRASTDAADATAIAPTRRMARRRLLPAPLQDYVGGDLDAVRWSRAGPGVHQAILRTGRDATARLLRIRGGAAMPEHGHRGLELTLVLQGAFRDAEDRFGPGDIEIAGSDLHHTPVAEAGPDCICLAATDAPLRFSSLLPRIAQRFLRI